MNVNDELTIDFEREELQWVTYSATMTEKDWKEFKNMMGEDLPQEANNLTFAEVCDIFENKRPDIVWTNQFGFCNTLTSIFTDFMREVAIDSGYQDMNYADEYDANEKCEVKR